jgi:HK97 family phage prohead protease
MPTLAGLAAPYGVETLIATPAGGYVEVLRPGVFAAAAGTRLPLLSWHDRQQFPVGVVTRLTEHDDGLRLEATMTAGSPHARAAWAHILDGSLPGLSVGFRPLLSDWRLDDDGRPAYVERLEADLTEVSVVPVPAYAAARVTRVDAADTTTPHLDEWAAWLVDNRRPAAA